MATNRRRTRNVDEKTVDQGTKLFVLDTNVLMADPNILFGLEEHHVLIPMVVLEELDNHKSGLSEVNRNSRKTIRTVDELEEAFIAKGGDSSAGIPLSLLGNKRPKGFLFFESYEDRPEKIFDERKNDNAIIELARHLSKKVGAAESPLPYTSVVVLSNDINVRVKARRVGLIAEGIHSGRELSDEDVIPSNVHVGKPDFWDDIGDDIVPFQKDGETCYTIGKRFPRWHVNDFVVLPGMKDDKKFLARVIRTYKNSVALKPINGKIFGDKNSFEVSPRNDEQRFALSVLLDPDIHLVTLVGVAGTGKTFLALAAALGQVVETNAYDRIIMTRETVPMGKEQGFLPGNEQEKMDPWMGALKGNLKELARVGSSEKFGDAKGFERDATDDLLLKKIERRSIAFMRGETFAQTFLIVDEVQNITPKQAKSLISRAGADTKVVFLGNVAQIDTPFLDETNNGLVHVLHEFRENDFQRSAYVHLLDGVRSELADAANKYL